MQTVSKKDVLENIDFKELAKKYKTGSLTKQFMKKMIESMLEEHTRNSGVSKNGKYTKKVKSDAGEIELEIPRDRDSSFEPQIFQNTKEPLVVSMIRLLPYMQKG